MTITRQQVDQWDDEVSDLRAEIVKYRDQRDALAKALRDVWAQPAFSIMPADVRDAVEAALRAVDGPRLGLHEGGPT